ncbi:MAG: hypothetical protein RXO54_06400 [Acidilobus sp.]
MSGQESSKEVAYSQAERAIIEYLKGDLRGSLDLVWHLVLEDLSLARSVKDKWGGTVAEWADAVAADLSVAGEVCYVTVNVLGRESLSKLVNMDAGRYWGLLSDVMGDLVEIRKALIEALNSGKVNDLISNELSPMVREKVDELLRYVIDEVSAAVARCECEKR